MPRTRWVLAALVVAALLAVGCQRQQSRQGLSGRTIRVATDATYPPFEMIDPANKNIVGYDIDLINAICALANCKTSIKSAAWDGIFPALQKGDYDAVISGVTITAERDKTMDFTDPYIEVGQVVLVRANETRIKGVGDLATRTVAVQRGTTNDDAASTMQKERKIKNIKRFPTFDLAVKSLLNRDVDAVIIDSVAGAGYMGTNPGKLKVAGEKFTSESLGIVVREGDAELQTAFNAALKVLRENGTLDRLYQKWIVDYKPGS
jgi:ABC-type amino acid transport substrate-binding protein